MWLRPGKECVLREGEPCVDCGDCDRCDLDETKQCDNCCKCLEGDADYRELGIDSIETPETGEGSGEGEEYPSKA